MGMTEQDPGCCCAAVVPCGSCDIPAQDLTLSWTNPITGPGSTTLTYQTTPSTAWVAECVDQLIFTLNCQGGTPAFRVDYFLSGTCPTGLSSFCSTGGGAGHKLDGGTVTCGASFLWTITVNSTDCPNLATFGYTSFTISI